MESEQGGLSVVTQIVSVNRCRTLPNVTMVLTHDRNRKRRMSALAIFALLGAARNGSNMTRASYEG